MTVPKYVYTTDDLDVLAAKLLAVPQRDKLRSALLAAFQQYNNYSTPAEWNRAVRLCECLAVIGWGDSVGVEAHTETYVNGYPETFFVTPRGAVRYLDAVWRPRNGGIMVAPDLSTVHELPQAEITPVVCQQQPLLSQRNWLPKCPVKIVRTLNNCYPGSRALLDSIDHDLNPMLLDGMRPELYGNSLNRIDLNCAMSFDDGPHCKTNYVIADESLKLRKSEYYGALLEMFNTDEIEQEGLFLRPRFDIGPFRKATGRVFATIVFEKEFSALPLTEQKRRMAGYFLTAIDRIAARRKKLGYNFTQMRTDFESILDRWINIDKIW
ncbi:MAG: hypothetical protein HDT06_06565 [Bacteroidales bacterium]|nr:hypothetical protein [Bacteroidales bacterium]